MPLFQLKRERERRGWTQGQVAEMIGTSQVNVSRWENSSIFPSHYYRQKLSKLFEKSPQELGLVSNTDDNSIRNLNTPPSSQVLISVDWGEAPHPNQYYGRDLELRILKEWLLDWQCRVVTIVGLGGIGKTSLAAKITEQFKDKFAYVFWRSLQDAPSLQQFLQSCLQFLFNEPETNLPKDVDSQTSLLLTQLRERRCLIVLDNVETILEIGEETGFYRKGYEGYGKLFQRIGEAGHQSCLLLTSREKPHEVAFLEGDNSPVRSYRLEGLDAANGEKILRDKGLLGEKKALESLIDHYAGNPLSLKLVSEFILEVFAGDIDAFLREGERFPSDFRAILEQQFDRLSALEQVIIYWLAIARDIVTFKDLQEDMISLQSTRALQEALRSLRRRDLIETTTQGFKLQYIFMDYVTNRFVDQVYQEINTGALALFESHALMKAQAKEYSRENQERFILLPIVQKLLANSDRKGIEKTFTNLLSMLRRADPQQPSYAAGNTLNLLIRLECDLERFDFSNLMIRQAYLQNVELHRVNFSYACFERPVFADTFGSIFSLAFSPNGERFAAGTANGEIRLWNTDGPIPLHTYPGHLQWVYTLAFNNDGDVLASGSGDGTIRLWDINTKLCLKILRAHLGWVRSIAFHPHGELLASGSEDQTIRLWDVTTGQCLKVLQGHTKRVSSIAFHPHGELLASGSEDQTIRLWDVTTGQCLKVLQGHTRQVWSVSFNPHGELLASGSEDQTIRLWDVTTGQCLKVLQGHTKRVSSIAFHPHGELLASGSEDQTIRLWDVTTGQCLKVLQGHKGHNCGIKAVAFHPHGELLASGSEDQTIRLWDVTTGQCLKVLQGHTKRVSSVAYSSNGKMLTSGSEDNLVRLWYLDRGQSHKVLQGHTNRIRSVAFNRSGEMIASGSEDQTIRLWDTNNYLCMKILIKHSDTVRSVAFSPDSKMLVSGGDDNTLCLWDVTIGQCLKVLKGHTKRVREVDFDPNGSVLVSCSEDRTIRLWDTQTGECLRVLEGHEERVWSVAFSPDGCKLASSSEDRTIRLWDTQTGECLRVLEGHEKRVWSVAFSPDGCKLASSSDDQTIRLWKVHDGYLLNTLTNMPYNVRSIAFSPDGQLLALPSNEGTIELWDVNTKELITVLKSEGLYEHMNILKVQGLTDTQKATIRTLGAIEQEEQELR